MPENKENRNYYLMRDSNFIKYNTFRFQTGDFEREIRGNKPEKIINKKYAACIGAAQTFGVFCTKPFPEILQEKLNFQFFNFGIGGGKAGFFSNNEDLIKFINNGKFAILQILSARGESNSLVSAPDDQGQKNVYDKKTGIQMGAKEFYIKLLRNQDRKYVKKIVMETRENWVKNNIELIKKIEVPIILFWFSIRNPYYKDEYNNVNKLFEEFPQLVNKKMINELIPFIDYYVKCTTTSGFPQRLKTPTTDYVIQIKKGEEIKKKYNTYYPSPEMHEDAAEVLQPVCAEIINHL